MKLMLNFQIIYILSLILYGKCEEAKKIYNNNYLVPQTPSQISQVKFVLEPDSLSMFSNLSSLLHP